MKTSGIVRRFCSHVFASGKISLITMFNSNQQKGNDSTYSSEGRGQ